MRRLIFLAAARRNLLDIAGYITRQSRNPETAHAFVNRLREQCRKLATQPGTLGRDRPELGPGVRSFPVKNHVIFFRYGENVLEVVNVLEGHRDIEARFGDDDEA